MSHCKIKDSLKDFWCCWSSHTLHPISVNRFPEKERQKMEAKKRIEDAKEELEKRMKLHKMSRDSIYPKGSSGHSVSRTHVPDTLVSFEVSPFWCLSPLSLSVCQCVSLALSLALSHSPSQLLCLSSVFLWFSLFHILSRWSKYSHLRHIKPFDVKEII